MDKAQPSELVERQDEYLFAWTPGPSDGSWRYYPPFVNVSRKAGKIVVIVRASEDTSGEFPVAGAWAECTIPDEEAERLGHALIERLTPTPEPCRLREALVEARGALCDAQPFIDIMLAEDTSCQIDEARAKIDAALSASPAEPEEATEAMIEEVAAEVACRVYEYGPHECSRSIARAAIAAMRSAAPIGGK